LRRADPQSQAKEAKEKQMQLCRKIPKIPSVVKRMVKLLRKAEVNKEEKTGAVTSIKCV
jgi:hypothetical protein